MHGTTIREAARPGAHHPAASTPLCCAAPRVAAGAQNGPRVPARGAAGGRGPHHELLRQVVVALLVRVKEHLHCGLHLPEHRLLALDVLDDRHRRILAEVLQHTSTSPRAATQRRSAAQLGSPASGVAHRKQQLPGVTVAAALQEEWWRAKLLLVR